MGQIQDQQRKAQATLDDIAKNQKEIVDYVHNQEKRQAEADKAAAEAAEMQNTLSALNSGVSILATLLGQLDPKAGRAVSLVGNAAIQIGTSAIQFAKLAANVGGIGAALGSMAGAALTGNIIGAVLSLLPLFSDDGPSPEEQILEQVNGLRQDVRELGKSMEERFNHIDQSLSTIYTQMMDQFDRIDLVLGEVHADVADVKTKLVSMQSQLTHLEGGLWGSLNDGFRRDLWQTIDQALGYTRRTGLGLPRSAYTAADSRFYTWATFTAFDQAATGPTNRSYSQEDIADELSKYPMDANTAYLAALPRRALGLPALSTKPFRTCRTGTSPHAPSSRCR